MNGPGCFIFGEKFGSGDSERSGKRQVSPIVQVDRIGLSCGRVIDFSIGEQLNLVCQIRCRFAGDVYLTIDSGGSVAICVFVDGDS